MLRLLSSSRPSLPSRTVSSIARKCLSTKPFDKVLIANRGEISQRVMRTCNALGIKTVAIYSTADAHAPFVEMADEAICIGPPASNQSYLNSEKILGAIRATGAQAVHPGYGFMSENAEFSKQVTDMGVAWLGPSPYAVRDMGDKLMSKRLAQEAGVHIIPGYDSPMENVDHALQVANDIGYPILLKAQAGGGGKGMRVCRSDAEVIETFPMATEEGLKFFKDPRLLCEKFIDDPHHIEFQVLAGAKGKTSVELANLTSPIDPDELDILVFPERECSIQRRHQKVIEESPSVLLTEETRLKMVEQVKALVRQVGYTSAGTVEWLVDSTPEQNFFFLEMNTRLQVEHPITEAVSGVDLVEGMLHVGAGHGIPQKYLDMLGDRPYMAHCGHAVEARVYAEDPLRGFLPSTGPLIPYQEPTLEGVRVDSGVAQGHVVSPHYDPMLSKVICYADTREAAVEGLARAMDNYVIEGVQHNGRLVNAVLRNPDFIAGITPTSFLPTHYPDGFHGVELTTKQKEQLAAIAVMVGKIRQEMLKDPIVPGSTDEVVVRLGGMFGEAFCVRLLDETTASVTQLLEEGEANEVLVALDEPLDYTPTGLLANALINDKPITVQVLGENVTGEIKVQMYGADMPVLLQSPREFELSKYMHEPVAMDTSAFILSPMPGQLIKMTVEEGDHVEVGQELCIVEAMKMQNIIRSPRTGMIGKCFAKEGSSLRADEKIIEFAAEDTTVVEVA